LEKIRLGTRTQNGPFCTRALSPSHPTSACTQVVRRLPPCRHQLVPRRHSEIHVAHNVAVGLCRRLALRRHRAARLYLLHHVAGSDLELEGESCVATAGPVLPRALGTVGRAAAATAIIACGDIAGPVDSHELGEAASGER
jgi:hypothetical protein